MAKIAFCLECSQLKSAAMQNTVLQASRMKRRPWANSSSHLQCAVTLSRPRHTAHIKTDVTCYYSSCCFNTILKCKPSTCRLWANIILPENLWSSPITSCCAELLPCGVWQCQYLDTKRAVHILHELADWGWHYFIMWFHKPKSLKTSHYIHNGNSLLLIIPWGITHQ